MATMMMNQQFLWRMLLALQFVLFITATILPPRLKTEHNTLRVKEGQTEVVLECSLVVGDDPIAYRWLKQYKLVTADLGFAYRTYRKVHLALHTITLYHQGIYECEAANDAGVNAKRIEVIVERGDYTTQFNTNGQLPDTSEILSDLSASLNDVLAAGNCDCDVLFFMHASPDAPQETLAMQANFVNTVAQPIISENIRVSAMTYSDYVNPKISFAQGTNVCALKEGLRDLSHDKWSTRIQPVLREALKKFRKSKKECKVLFLPIFRSLGTEGAQPIAANYVKAMNITVFILEVTDAPIPGVEEMASKRGDGMAYHWWIPQKIWPTIISYMSYMPEELTGCMIERGDIEGICVGEGANCTQSSQCMGAGFGCLQGICQSLECSVKPNLPGCCSEKGDFWCGDVSLGCKDKSVVCDGKIQCMNGVDEDRCWKAPCAREEARCQSSTLCLSMDDLCDGEAHCPGAEDEDPNFCRSFPCPSDRTFRCRSGKCISSDRLCDGSFRDCSDGEDENLEYCAEKHVCPTSRPFKCDYGVCISDRMVCDGAYNCLDALDERLCMERTCPAKRPFKCGDGKCVGLSMICNGVVDACSDGLDEFNCTHFVCPTERSFKCISGRCIDNWLRCDGRDDCGDNTDEENCLEESPSSTTASPPKSPEPTSFPKPTKASCRSEEFYCSSGACLPKDKVCDGRRNCIDGEDEEKTMCLEFPCPPARNYRCPGDGGTCVDVRFCDGVSDCPDGSDELNCIFDTDDIHSTEPEEDDITIVEDEEPSSAAAETEPSGGAETEPSGSAEPEPSGGAEPEPIGSAEPEPSGGAAVPEPEGETVVEDISPAASVEKGRSSSATPTGRFHYTHTCLCLTLIYHIVVRFR